MNLALSTYHLALLTRGLLIFSLCLLVSCRSSTPTDLRSLAPAETLVYLESKDLEKTLAALTENKAFGESSETKPDFSFLANTQLAVAVTGFEASKKELTEESEVLNFQPRFAAIADTHRWESTNLSLVESQIAKFARETYGDDAKLEKTEKSGAKWFTWTDASEDRKLFVAVSGSVIYLGNDETVIEKCLAVRRGEAENLTRNESLKNALERGGNDEKRIAFGYVTTEGVPQVANLAGVFAAWRMSEDADVQSFTARVLPQILQKTAKEFVWTARNTEQGIEDRYFIKTQPEISNVFKETLVPVTFSNEFQKTRFLPPDAFSVTCYNLQNPPLAWRSVLLAAAKQTDETSGKIILQFSNSLFEVYGISDAESFLSAVSGGEIVTAKFDEEGEKAVVIADVKDAEKLKKSIAGEINFKTPPEKLSNAEIWKSEDKLSAAAFTADNKLIIGETESVLACLKAAETGQNFQSTEAFRKISDNGSSPAIAATVTKDTETAGKIAGILGSPKEENKTVTSFYTTETRFDAGGAYERKTVSNFGLIGMILEVMD